MASSSSSSVQQKKYEVFLSLSEDTRNNFASHLRAALKRYQINTFVYCPLEGGGEETFMLAIEESKVSVIVLSKDYVSSSWCLEQLCKILECKEKNGLKVVPIFYHVDHSHVERAFEKHQERFMDGTDKVKRWKAALFGVANLAEFYLDEEEDRLETELIEDIVKFIWEKLNELSSDFEGLVGMDSRIEKLKELLDHMEPKGVRIIGIWGMPGVGKTTTADVLFKHISCQFDASYFLANVREKSMSQVLECLPNELFRVLKTDLRIVKISLCIRKYCPRKVLIVLDDVNNSQLVEYLIGDQTRLGPGSTIIVTSRDRRVLRLIRAVIYTVEKLTYDQAIEFCNQFAFGGNHSISIEQTMELSRWVVRYADGIPLALKILGCFLCDEKEGTLDSALRRLEKAPNKEIHQLFSISYDGLTNEEKRIFLDVACFFEGEDKNRVADILDGCGFSAHLGITVLNDWFLLIILNNNLQMHRLAQVMGWEIVRRESEHPGKRSRLWRYEDIIDVVTTNKGTETVEGIFLNMTEIEKPICINPVAFSRMCNLRLLKIYGPHSQVDYKVHLPIGFQICSNKLAYLHWHCYPSESLPLNFDPESLVELHMHYSCVIKLWEGTRKLQKLKWIDLSYSKNLKEMPDLSKAPNLVRINLVGCTSLLEIPSIASFLPNLQAVYLSGCSNLKNFPLLSWNVQELLLDGTAIEEVPAEIQHFSRLVELNMKNCQRLKKFPRIHQLKSLKYLFLSGCSNLANFAENQHMEISANTKLSIQQRFQSVLELPPNLQHLDAHDCTLLQAESSSFPICRGWGQKFIFTNCIKLDQNIIWAKTQLSIQQTATADVKRYQKFKKQDQKPEFSSICVCFPGSEIPEWFNSKNLGSSVTTLSPLHLFPLHLLHDHKFVGFALCAIVAFEEGHKDLGFTVKCRCNFKTKGYDCGDCLSNWSVWDKSGGPRIIGSDHVFLGYDFNFYSHWYSGESKYHLIEASFEFSACDSDSGSPLDSCIIKKCGVCLLYAEDDLSEIETVGDSESKSDAEECNYRMIEPGSPYNPHFLSGRISANRPHCSYYHDEAEPSALMRKTEQ